MIGARASSPGSPIDYGTLISLSVLAYVVTTVLHECLGHAATCALMGGSVRELGAFYVDCQYDALSDRGIRLVAIGGTLASALTGVVGFGLLRRLTRLSSHGAYFLWLLSTISLLEAAGYLLFSGITGLGDFGVTRDGALFQLAPEWLWRSVTAILGLAGYAGVIIASLRVMDTLLGGERLQRVSHAQRLALVSYLSGAAMAILVASLNPHGMVIVLISAGASTLGGTSALAWMMQLLKRDRETGVPLLSVPRDWRWIIAGALAVIAYALVLGPSIRP